MVTSRRKDARWAEQGVSANKNVTDIEQDHDTGYEVTKTEIMKSSMKSRDGKVGTRLGHIGHRPERLQINQ